MKLIGYASHYGITRLEDGRDTAIRPQQAAMYCIPLYVEMPASTGETIRTAPVGSASPLTLLEVAEKLRRMAVELSAGVNPADALALATAAARASDYQGVCQMPSLLIGRQD